MILAAVAIAAAQPAFAATHTPEPAPYPSDTSPEMRVATIGYRLAVRNLDQCPRKAPQLGLLLHDLTSYDDDKREWARATFGLGAGIGILGVVPGSAAADAGLVPGDEIIALAGAPVEAVAPPAPSPRASYDRVEGFVSALKARLQAGAAALVVRHGTREWTVELPTRLGCAAEFSVMPRSGLDAWSDQRYVAVTRGLAEVAPVDELAFVMAHELAHIALGHGDKGRGLLIGLGIGSHGARQRERDADRVGLTMTRAAGYSAAGAEGLLMRLARASGPQISLTHPSFRSRIEAIKAAEAAEPK